MTSDGGPGGALAIHLGGDIGWCYSPSEMGLWRLPKTDDHGALGAALVDAISDFTKVLRPGSFLVSGPPGENDGGRPEVAVLHVGLLMCVRLFAFRRNIIVEVPSLVDVREKILGRGDLSSVKVKLAALSFAKRRGISTIAVETAHSLVLWEYDHARIGA